VSKLGYVKSWRQELESDIWLMPPMYYRVWTFLLKEVSWASNTIPTVHNFSIHVNPGQGFFSVSAIADGVAWFERNSRKKPNKKTILVILKWLEFNSMICRESNRDGTFITICNWGKYQQDKKAKVTQVAPHKEPQVAPHSVHTKEVKEVKEVKKTTSVQYTEKFEQFWKEYPRKIGKKKAFISWKKQNCDNGKFSQIMSSLDSFKRSDQWTKNNGQFIPHGVTWVNGSGWEDEIEVVSEWE